jgi:hypothetical protein
MGGRGGSGGEGDDEASGGGGIVGRGSDEGQTKSRKSTDSREEWPRRRQEETHQRSHHGKPECDEQPSPNNDIPHAQSHNQGKHTRLTMPIALSSHGAEEGQK